MGLSLEGFGGEFEIGKVAFELEDLKKEKEKRRGGNKRIYLFLERFRFQGGNIYIGEKEKNEEIFLGGQSTRNFGKKQGTSNGDRAVI